MVITQSSQRTCIIGIKENLFPRCQLHPSYESSLSPQGYSLSQAALCAQEVNEWKGDPGRSRLYGLLLMIIIIRLTVQPTIIIIIIIKEILDLSAYISIEALKESCTMKRNTDVDLNKSCELNSSSCGLPVNYAAITPTFIFKQPIIAQFKCRRTRESNLKETVCGRV